MARRGEDDGIALSAYRAAHSLRPPRSPARVEADGRGFGKRDAI
jgi:hypothetical protein